MFKDHFTMMEGDAGTFLGTAVFGITKDGMFDVGELCTDLVVAAGMEGDFNEGGVDVGFKGGVGKNSFFAGR